MIAHSAMDFRNFSVKESLPAYDDGMTFHKGIHTTFHGAGVSAIHICLNCDFDDFFDYTECRRLIQLRL